MNTKRNEGNSRGNSRKERCEWMRKMRKNCKWFFFSFSFHLLCSLFHSFYLLCEHMCGTVNRRCENLYRHPSNGSETTNRPTYFLLFLFFIYFAFLCLFFFYFVCTSNNFNKHHNHRNNNNNGWMIKIAVGLMHYFLHFFLCLLLLPLPHYFSIHVLFE